MTRVFPILWTGFFINLLSGLILLISEAADKGTDAVFLIKLSLIAAGVVITTRIRRRVFGSEAVPVVVPPRARGLAITSLAVWGGAIVAGRLMAYLK
jgi:hypothetical protein